MDKATKFIYVSLDKIDDFQKVKEKNNKIIPCSVYINKEDGRIYFVERKGINNNIENI